MVGVKRTPLSGGNSSITRSDSLSTYWFIESKLRSKIPFLKDFRAESDKAITRGRMPLCIYVSGGISYAFLKYTDFIDAVNALHPQIGNSTTDDLFFCSKWFVWTEYNESMPFKDTFMDTQKKAASERKIPVVVIHEKGKKSDICLLTLVDFVNHLQPLIDIPAVGLEAPNGA